MVRVTLKAGKKHLFRGLAEEAVPAALQCLRFCADAYGMASVHLVPPYLILAESSICEFISFIEADLLLPIVIY